LLPQQRQASYSAKQRIFIYFLKPHTTDEATAIFALATAPKHFSLAHKCTCSSCSTHASSSFPSSSTSSSSLSSLSTTSSSDTSLLQCFDNTLIFKSDASKGSYSKQSLSQREHEAATRFPPFYCPFIVTTFCRAHFDTLAQSNSSIVTLMKPTFRSPAQSSIPTRTAGIVLDRYVASAADIIDVDERFDESLNVSAATRQLFNFKWQTTTAVCDQYKQRTSYEALCEATCKRFLEDLRTPSLLFHHLLHLCHAVEFIHSYGVLH
jgi:hypothetical protein